MLLSLGQVIPHRKVRSSNLKRRATNPMCPRSILQLSGNYRMVTVN
jgi:hypothetical protein